jgi:ribonuclease J
LIENGDVLELSENYAQVVESHDVGKTFIDENGIDEIDYEIVRERKKLAFGGMISLVVTIDKQTKELISAPQITMHGVAGFDPINGFLKEAQKSIADAVLAMKPEDFKNKNLVTENLRLHLKKFIQREIGAKPVIVPTVVEI